MGLDQYAHASAEGLDKKELAYWRKHPYLQGFMEDLWRAKGNEGEFNCVDLELNVEDIDALEAAVSSQNLPETTGFFFGGDSSDYYKEADQKFIADARKALAEGYTITYSSWW